MRLHASLAHGLAPHEAVRDIVRLESAVAAPIEGFGDRDGYPRLFEKVAALGYRLAAGHGFVDGNKRTAMLVMAQTLAWNDYNLDWPEPMQIIVLSLVGAGHLDQAGLLHALTVGYGFDPTKDDFP